MTPEEKNMLERALKLAEDNNALLVKMNRRARTGRVLQIFYWLIILGISFGAYYVIQPYVMRLESIVSGNSNSGTAASSTNIQQGVENLLKSFGSK
jgi:Sec-independent protein secretion pathway component TatC